MEVSANNCCRFIVFYGLSGLFPEQIAAVFCDNFSAVVVEGGISCGETGVFGEM